MSRCIVLNLARCLNQTTSLILEDSASDPGNMAGGGRLEACLTEPEGLVQDQNGVPEVYNTSPSHLMPIFYR